MIRASLILAILGLVCLVSMNSIDCQPIKSGNHHDMGELAISDYNNNDDEMIGYEFTRERRQKRQQPMMPADQGGFLSGLNNLAQQAQSLGQAQQLLQSAQSLFQPTKQMGPPNSGLIAQNPAEATVKSALDTAQVTSSAAMNGAGQTAQTGMRSALSELSSGLQKLAQNNPNLLPDVKGLYQRVSTSLGGTQPVNSGSLGSNIVPANNQYELADNLAKVAMPGLQVGPTPAPSLFPTNLLQNPFQG